ncbi:SGD1 [Sanghuangporus sanghuang]
MTTRKGQSTTRLPQSIIDEINAQSGASSSGHRRASGSHSRKAERKAERQLAKQRKARFFAHGAPRRNGERNVVTETKDTPPPRKKVKFDLPPEMASLSALKAKPSGHTTTTGTTLEKKKLKTAKSKERGSRLPLNEKQTKKNAVTSTKKWSRIEEEEDAYIATLERKLGVKKDKKGKSRYASEFEEDGFLDLLVDLDENVLNQAGDDDLEESSDQNAESDNRDEASKLDDDSDESGQDEIDTESEDEQTGFTSEDSDADGEEAEVMDSDGKPTTNGAAGQSSVSKYIPPHLRKQVASQQSNGFEIDAKLVRQLKGLLNRLSEQNIDSILKEIESLYRSHRRHDITSTLTNLIIEGTCSHSILLDSYVALHAGLVACLHKIIGVELAAYFVQNVVATFERHYNRSKEPYALRTEEESNAKIEDEVGKECSNLLVLLSELYNYHVISCTLVYDVIRLVLRGELSELDIELILKIARGSGAQLRQDDPSALKDIIQIVQTKLKDQRNASSRTRFMVETLVNLKNNKLKKATAGGQGGNETKERISKIVAGIGKKYHVRAHEPLRISLSDLRQADSKGKWWLVGAAWGGDPLVEQQNSATQSTTISAEKALRMLAKKQGMNTDVRRSIFVVLMSSDDYVDACDRLAQLNLTEVQQREIIRVLLHCCGNEKSYNPYYTLISAHLCKQSHSHRVTLQYCFWDFLRGLGETNVGGAEMARDDQDEDAFELDRVSSTRMSNVARAYAWLVAKDCVAITILKTLDFVSLKAKTKSFLKQFFTHLFVDTQDPSSVPRLGNGIDAGVVPRRDEKALAAVLLKATRLPTLSLGILHFLSKTFSKVELESQDPSDAFVRWCCQVSGDVLQDVLQDATETQR